MKKNQRINVILGASGRIGFPLCIELKKRGEYVRALVRSDNHVTDKLRAIVDEIVYGDIRDKASLMNAFDGADIVFHLAAVVSIETKPAKIITETNIDGTKNVIEACLDCRVKRLIYTSSVHALDFLNTKQTLYELNEYYPDKVNGAYARTKAEGANMVLRATREGLDAVIGLPSGVIGPYEYAKSNIGQMIADVAERKLRVLIKGRYDFVDVRDVVIALCDLVNRGKSGECYTISGEVLSVKEMLQTVAEAAGVKKPFFVVPLWLVKLFAPIAERRSLKRGKKPTFTPYAIRVLQDNCNFSHEKLTALTGYSPRPAVESLRDQTEFYFKELKGKK